MRILTFFNCNLDVVLHITEWTDVLRRESVQELVRHHGWTELTPAREMVKTVMSNVVVSAEMIHTELYSP